jgi:signal peptidase
MEITPTPYRPATTPWGRLLLLVVVIAPVSVLVLLPSGLGLQRYVASGGSMAGDRPDSIARGSLVLERLVPVDELRPGDVITFRRPAPSGGAATVTHRIVSVGVGGIRTRGDAESATDPWLLRPGPLVPRVVWTVPVVGYAYLALGDWRFWAAVAVLVVGGVVVAAGTGGRRGRTPPSRRAPERRTTASTGSLDVGRVTAGAGAGALDGAIGVD